MGASSALTIETLTAHLRRRDYADPDYLQRRFRSYIEVDPVEECWKWTGAVMRTCAQFPIGYRSFSAARVAWLLYRGPLAGGARLKRSCPTSCCVNPAHQALIVAKERPKRDKWRRLTPEEIRALVHGYQQGEVSIAALAAMFRCSPTTVWHHVRGHRRYSRAVGIELPPPRLERRRATCVDGGTA